MMAEFKPIDTKKYLRSPSKSLDKTDKTSEKGSFVSFVKSNLDEYASGKARVFDQAQNSPAPLLNKGRDKPADKPHYHAPHETTFGCSNVTAPLHLEIAANFQNSGTLHLYGDLLLNLMGWAAQHQELCLEHPGAAVLNARPEHIRDAVKTHPWGVVYDIDRRVLVTWGNVPTSALRGKHDLETDELLLPEQVAA